MNSAAGPRPSFRNTSRIQSLTANRWLRVTLWSIVVALSVLKFCYLAADFPNESPWLIDQAKFTDEGWWSNAAVAHALTGHWFVPGDYNPAVALPVWPFLISLLFRFTGVSFIAARALNVAISVATLGVVFLLLRRFARPNSGFPALLGVVLLSASPFAFAFNRLAILDTLVVFEFLLLLLLASYASQKRIGLWIVIFLLAVLMVLTKTTALLLLPAVLWMAWSAARRTWRSLLRALVFIAVLPAALLTGYSVLVSAMGYGLDYRYFFSVNAMPGLDWGQTFSTLTDLFQNCFWIDRVLYPVGLAVLILALAWRRKLWANPLFTASWIAIAIQAAFIFRRQQDYAPRYFLVMLAPLVCIVAIAFADLRLPSPKSALFMLLAPLGAFLLNLAMIGHFLTHRDYDLRDAARSIAQLVRSHPEQKPLLMGVSGNQLSLMTGIPSINDGFGTERSSQEMASYKPGWYAEWNDTPRDPSAFAGYTLEKMASYPIFDDEDRTTLILYKIVPDAVNPSEPSLSATPTPSAK